MRRGEMAPFKVSMMGWTMGSNLLWLTIHVHHPLFRSSFSLLLYRHDVLAGPILAGSPHGRVRTRTRTALHLRWSVCGLSMSKGCRHYCACQMPNQKAESTKNHSGWDQVYLWSDGGSDWDMYSILYLDATKSSMPILSSSLIIGKRIACDCICW